MTCARWVCDRALHSSLMCCLASVLVLYTSVVMHRIWLLLIFTVVCKILCLFVRGTAIYVLCVKRVCAVTFMFIVLTNNE